MSKYLLFSGDDYYPSGGWCDYSGAFPTVEAAIEAAQAANIQGFQECDWWHVVDAESREIVTSGGYKPVYADNPSPE
jgi:hypothetical protein